MTTTNEDKEAAAILLRMRQPRVCYDPVTKRLDISYSTIVQQRSNWPELDDFLQTAPTRLGETTFGLSVRTRTPHSDGIHRSSLRIRHRSKGTELHHIVAAWRARHDVKAWAYSAGVNISLEDRGIISWILRRCCHAIQQGDLAVDVRRRVQFLFEIFEVVFRGLDVTMVVPSARAVRDAEYLLDWVDKSCLDHATVLTVAGFTYLTSIHKVSYFPSNTFYGRPGNPKRRYVVSSTEHGTSDGTKSEASCSSDGHR